MKKRKTACRRGRPCLLKQWRKQTTGYSGMKLREIQDAILQLKKENNVCILAHSYQTHDILEVADFTGDSYQLSVMAKTAPQSVIVLCGVRFMAETVKMLSPQKQVILSSPCAGCPMAEQITPQQVADFKRKNPGFTVVAYINTSAALKTQCDVCVTSSSALQIVGNIKNDKILFLPDRNLGSYVKKHFPEKEVVLMDGCCPVHAAITGEQAQKSRAQHKDALLLAHPECVPEVLKHADFVGSTSAIMQFAKQSDHQAFIIGTEISIAQHLQYACPEKSFYPLSSRLLCPDMKATSLIDVLHCVQGTGGEEIIMEEEQRIAAVRCINKMIELGG